MDIKQPTKSLSETNFNLYPLWRYDEHSDLYYPIMSMDEIPEYQRDFFIKTEFISPNNMHFQGYILGVIDIYCIVLFFQGKKFVFNKNLPDRALETFKKLMGLMLSDKNISILDIFPMKYETQINLENYKNISGEFNAFEKLKNMK